MFGKKTFGASGLLLAALVTGACFMPLTADAQDAAQRECVTVPRSPLVVNVKDKGAKGDGRTDDTEAIQAAIDDVAGTGGTVLVPGGTYMVDAVDKKRRLALRSDMALKLDKGAILKAFPNDSRKYSVLSISGVSNVTVIVERSKAIAPSTKARRARPAWDSESNAAPRTSPSPA
jgi:polygalacturonase